MLRAGGDLLETAFGPGSNCCAIATGRCTDRAATMQNGAMFTPRITWTDLPEAIRAEVEARLGRRVTEARSQMGGFSPGVADRLVLAGGTRAFLKAVHPDLNAGSADLYRREARVNALLPDGVPAPRLRHTFEADGWIVLLFDDISGRQPALPWSAADFALALDAFDTLGRVPAGHLDLPAASDTLDDDFAGFGRLIDDPDPGLDPWLASHLGELHARTRAAASALDGDTLCLLDGRADNLLFAHGRVWLLDWPWACLGSPWLDASALASTAIAQGATFDVTSATDDWVVARGGTPEHVTGVLLGMLAYIADAARRPEVPGLPTLRAFHRRSRDALIPVVRDRLEGCFA